MKKLFILIFLIITIYIAFFNPNVIFSSILNSLEIWLLKIYPSFFAFYILSNILLNLNILKYFTFLVKPFIRFNSDKAYELYLLSIFIGNPTSSKLTYLELQKNSITNSDAIKLIKYHSFMNPLFIISIISLLNQRYKEIIITYILISIIINILLSIKKEPKYKIKNIDNDLIINIDYILESITGAISILIQVAGVIVFCNLLKDIILYFVPNTIIISSFLEVSRGVFDILNVNISNKIVIILGLITFQGLSINLQVYNNARDVIKLSELLIIRIIQSILIMVIMYFLIRFYFV